MNAEPEISCMTDEEREQLRAGLIQAGFWGADESGDPTTNGNDAEILQNRMLKRLRESITMVPMGPFGDEPHRFHIFVNDSMFNFRLASGEELPDAICRAALELPTFLERHLECRA